MDMLIEVEGPDGFCSLSRSHLRRHAWWCEYIYIYIYIWHACFEARVGWRSCGDALTWTGREPGAPAGVMALCCVIIWPQRVGMMFLRRLCALEASGVIGMRWRAWLFVA